MCAPAQSYVLCRSAQLYLTAVSETRHSTQICLQDSERNFFRFALFDSCVGGVDFHYSEKKFLDV